MCGHGHPGSQTDHQDEQRHLLTQPCGDGNCEKDCPYVLRIKYEGLNEGS